MQANRQGTPQHVSCLAVTPENAIPPDPNLVYDTPPCAQKKAHTALPYPTRQVCVRLLPITNTGIRWDGAL